METVVTESENKRNFRNQYPIQTDFFRVFIGRKYFGTIGTYIQQRLHDLPWSGYL